MPQTERKNGDQRAREVLASLDVKSDDREPILNNDLIAAIGGILGQATVTSSEHSIFNRWNLVTADGKIMELCAYTTRRGRVSSADVLAYDSLRIVYKEGEAPKAACMRGISDIGLVKDDDGTVSVEFVQKTDKNTRRIEVSDKGVTIAGNATGRNIPHRFIKDFQFF